MSKMNAGFDAQRGSANMKLLIIGVILFLIAHAGYNYIPVAYQSETMKQDMQTAVLQGSALPTGSNPVVVVKQKLQRSATENNLPADTFIDVKQNTNTIQARVYYKKRIDMFPFGLWTKEYTFDQTASPSGFLFKDN